MHFLKKSDPSDYSRKIDCLDSRATWSGSQRTRAVRIFLGSNKYPQVPISHLVHFWKIGLSRPKRHSRQSSPLANYASLKVYHRSPASVPETKLNDSKISQMVNMELRKTLWQTNRRTLSNINKMVILIKS